MKCKLFPFNSSKMGHPIWEHFPVVPISSVQQTAWKWQAVPQPRAAAEPPISPQPEREWKFEMRVFLLETEWWHPDRSAHLLHPSLNWITYQNSHIFLCRQLQISMGRTEVCCLVWRETGYFGRCMGLVLVILLCVRLVGIFPWCQLSFPVPSDVLRALPHWLTYKFYVRATLLLENLGHERHPSCCFLLWRLAVGFFTSLTPGCWCGAEDSGTCSLMAGTAVVPQKFLRHISTVWLPLMERTGLDDLKWSVLVLRLKHLNSPSLVSEINPASLLDSAVLRDVCETGQCSGTANWSLSERNSFPASQFSLTSSHKEFSLELIELAKAFKYFHQGLASFWPYKANQISREAEKPVNDSH